VSPSRERSFPNAANLSVQQSTPSIFHGGCWLHMLGRLGSGPSRRAQSSAPSLLAPAIDSGSDHQPNKRRYASTGRPDQGLYRRSEPFASRPTWPVDLVPRSRTPILLPFHRSTLDPVLERQCIELICIAKYEGVSVCDDCITGPTWAT
jgi:hypothetical protein